MEVQSRPLVVLMGELGRDPTTSGRQDHRSGSWSAGRRVRLCVSFPNCAVRGVLVFAGLHSSGCSQGVVRFLAHPRRTFVGLDGDVTVREPGEQTVVREAQSRSEDDALVEPVAFCVTALSSSLESRISRGPPSGLETDTCSCLITTEDGFPQLSVPPRCLVTDTCNGWKDATTMVTTMSQYLFDHCWSSACLNGSSCCHHL